MVWDLIISEEAEDHIWERHKIDASRLLETLENRSVMVPNRSGRRASHLLIGTDSRGQCYVIPVLPTNNPGTWEVIPAWPCRSVDLDRLRRSQSMTGADTMLHYMPAQRRPLEDEETDLQDPDTWDWDAAVWNRPSPRPAITVSVRLEREEARLLGAAAREAEMPVSRYLLQAALEAARRNEG